MKMSAYYSKITTYATPTVLVVKPRKWAGNAKRATVEKWMKANGITRAERTVEGLHKGSGVNIEREFIVLL
jgi:hypothetical protein